MEHQMTETNIDSEKQLATIACRLQELRTGHAPRSVTAILSELTLVVTLQDALSPAEKDLAQSPDGAAKVQEFHRQLFLNSSDEMRSEIERVTGRKVLEASAEIELANGAIVHAFTTGAMVQVFLLEHALTKNETEPN